MEELKSEGTMQTITSAIAAFPHLITGNDKVVNLYVDHHVLSQLRLCEAKFVEEILLRNSPKAQRYFSLEFGIWLHECLELFYKAFKQSGKAPELDPWITRCRKLYKDYDIDFFQPSADKLVKEYRSDEKKWYSLGGEEGALRLLIEYYVFYMEQRLRVVATEVFFGRESEILLGEFIFINTNEQFLVRCHLTGIIDLVVDNGYKIAPVDFKTTARFDGYESNDFDPHEGMTGYIFALNHYLKHSLGPELSSYTGCNDAFVHHISIASPSAGNPRFKPTYIHKTNQQLEEFGQRQLRTCKRMIDLMLGEQADYNTMICNSLYNNACPFRELHRQPTEQRENILKQFYEKRKAWDPKNRNLTNKKSEEMTNEPISVGRSV